MPYFIGMDLVRLVLERAKTSREAVDICSSLLEQFGQGGGCAEDDRGWCYENSFLFADQKEAWVFETSGKQRHAPAYNFSLSKITRKG